jgi:U-box domain
MSKTTEQIPDEYICPITQSVMVDPVIGSDGITYEKSAITEWLRSHTTSPVTRQPMVLTSLLPNYSVKSMIERYNRVPPASTIRAVQALQESDDHYYAIQVFQEDAKSLYASSIRPPAYVYTKPPVIVTPPTAITPMLPPTPAPAPTPPANKPNQKVIFIICLVALLILIIIFAISRAA